MIDPNTHLGNIPQAIINSLNDQSELDWTIKLGEEDEQWYFEGLLDANIFPYWTDAKKHEREMYGNGVCFPLSWIEQLDAEEKEFMTEAVLWFQKIGIYGLYEYTEMIENNDLVNIYEQESDDSEATELLKYYSLAGSPVHKYYGQPHRSMEWLKAKAERYCCGKWANHLSELLEDKIYTYSFLFPHRSDQNVDPAQLYGFFWDYDIVTKILSEFIDVNFQNDIPNYYKIGTCFNNEQCYNTTMEDWNRLTELFRLNYLLFKKFNYGQYYKSN